MYSSGTLWSLLAITLTCDLWSQKLISIWTQNTSVTKIGWNFLYRFFEILWSQGFRVIAYYDPDLWRFHPPTSPYTFVTKIGWNSLHWFLRYGVHKVFRTHRLTHSLTDGQTRIQTASVAVFQRWRRHKNTTVSRYLIQLKSSESSNQRVSVCICLVAVQYQAPLRCSWCGTEPATARWHFYDLDSPTK